MSDMLNIFSKTVISDVTKWFENKYNIKKLYATLRDTRAQQVAYFYKISGPILVEFKFKKHF